MVSPEDEFAIQKELRYEDSTVFFEAAVQNYFSEVAGYGYMARNVQISFTPMGGVKISKLCHVGGYNIFDTIRPDLITIGEHTTISTRCVILSHFVHQKEGHREWSYGEVKIGNNVFLGANVVICQPVTIGDNSVIAAGAVVTKDIPAGEIWGGVPAKFIKKI